MLFTWLCLHWTEELASWLVAPTLWSDDQNIHEFVYLSIFFVFFSFLTCFTFTARDRVIPIAGGAVLTREDGMSHQLISRQTLEGNGLAHIVPGTHHHPVAERLWVRALLQFVS